MRLVRLHPRLEANRRMRKEEAKKVELDDADHLGECPTCGKYRKKIEAGKLRPCYEWERIEVKEAQE